MRRRGFASHAAVGMVVPMQETLGSIIVGVMDIVVSWPLWMWGVAVLASLLFIGTVGLLMDRQSRLGRADEALDREKEARVEAEEALYSMAHDLKTPLVTLDHLLADVHGGPQSENPEVRPVTDTVVHVRQVVHSMQGLVDQMLEYAKEVEGAKEDGQAWVPTAVCEAVDLVRSKSWQKDARVHVEGGPDVCLCVAPQALRHVVLNLLDNAIKYGPEEDASIRVSWRRLDASMRGDGFVMEVADNGPGIALEDRLRVFKMLTRVPDRQGRDLPGTGVGLAMVRRMVHQHSGRVEVADAPEGGALLRVVYPASKVLTPHGPARGEGLHAPPPENAAADAVRSPG